MTIVEFLTRAAVWVHGGLEQSWRGVRRFVAEYPFSAGCFALSAVLFLSAVNSK